MPNVVTEQTFPKYVAIPEPGADLSALLATTQRLKENVELLTGQRGPAEYSLTQGLVQLRKQLVEGDKTVTGRIVEVNDILVEANNALAERTQIIETEISDARNGQPNLLSRITQVDTARVSGDTALATRATNLEVEMTAARQGQATVSARITQVDNARASGDSALASSVSTLSSTVGGHTSSISTLQSSVNGLNVEYSVQGNINGVTGGFIFTGVQKADNTGAIFNLEINANMTINGDVLINGTVTNPKVGNGAITAVAADQANASGVNVGINARGTGTIMIIVQWVISAAAFANSADAGEIWVIRNGGTIATAPVMLDTQPSANYLIRMTTVIVYDTVAAGSYTYSAQATTGLGGTHFMKIVVMELSK